MAGEKTHQSELERLETLQEKGRLGGGQKAIDRRHEAGKLTARERLNLLFDPDSFNEMNELAESQSIYFGMQEKKVPEMAWSSVTVLLMGEWSLPMPRMRQFSEVRWVSYTGKKYAGSWKRP